MEIPKTFLGVLGATLLAAAVTACGSGAPAAQPTAAPAAGQAKPAAPTTAAPAAAAPTAAAPAAAAPTAAAKPPASGQKTTIKFATMTAETFPYMDGMKKFKELAEKAGNGSIEVQLFHSGSLGAEREIEEGMLAGSIQMGIGAGAFTAFVPEFDLFELPFLIRDLPTSYKVGDGPVGQDLAKLAEGKGFKVLSYFSTGDQHLQSRNKAIKSLDDIKGMKIRVMEDPAILAGFKALGAVPVPMAYTAIYTGLQQGTLDGSAVDLMSVTSLKLTEVVKFNTMVSYLAEPRPVLISKKFYDGLPANVQKIVSDSAKDATTYERKVFEEKLTSALADIKKAGVQVDTLQDTDKWIAAMKPVYQEFGQKFGMDRITAIQNTK